MNAESLHALIIDRHFGELSPEVAELLASHLAQNPSAKAEADRILQALDATEQAMVQHADLAPVGALHDVKKATPAQTQTKRRWLTASTLAKAAVFAALLAVSGGAGFFAGRSQPPGITSSPSSGPVNVAIAPSATPRQNSPWANYKLAQNPDGGLRVVRIDTLASKKSTLR